MFLRDRGAPDTSLPFAGIRDERGEFLVGSGQFLATPQARPEIRVFVSRSSSEAY
jgi:hypothetical protein